MKLTMLTLWDVLLKIMKCVTPSGPAMETKSFSTFRFVTWRKRRIHATNVNTGNVHTRIKQCHKINPEHSIQSPRVKPTTDPMEKFKLSTFQSISRNTQDIVRSHNIPYYVVFYCSVAGQTKSLVIPSLPLR